MQQFSELSIDLDKSILKYGKSAQVRHFHCSTQRWYRATVTLAELEEDPTRSWLQTLADIFPGATLEEDGEEDGEEELSGRLLGTSGKADGLLDGNVSEAVETQGYRPSVAVDNLALVLCHPNGPLGNLEKLPKELRYEVYHRAFPRTFWQCYHTKRPGIALLGVAHSNRLLAILNVSEAVREEVLESVYCDRSLEVVTGTQVTAFNFPLLPTLQAGQTLDGTQARLPKTAELFSGIQVPPSHSSFNSPSETAVRENIARVVALLNSIARKQKLPRIRVSFKTNEETKSLQYYAGDFEALLGPLADLRLGKRSLDVKSKKPLVIYLLPPHSSRDGRDDFCDGIEESVRKSVPRFKRFSS